MMNYHFARQAWRALFVGVAAACFGVVGTPASASAQLRTSWDVNASVAQFDGPRLTNPSSEPPPADLPWLGQRTIGGALRFNHPNLQLNADGVLRDGDVSSRATGGIFALVSTPSWNGFRISASTNQRHVPSDGVTRYQYDPRLLALWIAPERVPTWQSRVEANISYARNSTGLWLRASSHRGAGSSDSISRWSYATGLNYQLRDVVFGVSMGTQRALVSGREVIISDVPVPGDTFTVKQSDTVNTNAWKRWSQASATLGWASGRLTLDAIVSARPRFAKNPAASWGEASASVAVTSRVAIVSSLRTSPRLPGVFFDERRVASVGLRVAQPSFWRPVPPAPVRSTSRSFNVRANAPGEYTITLNVPNARTVELAGDFTAWKAVTLRQVNAIRWEIVLKVDPGSHRCNVRIDGADWVAPPGVPAVNDEFNGRVGLFVAQ